MPRGDRTGPQSQGPKTGRGRGKCSSKGGSPAPQDQDGWEPAKAAGDQVKAPAGVRAKAEVQVRAKEGGLEKFKYFLKIGN